MKSSLISTTLLSLAFALTCSAQAQTQQWSTSLSGISPGSRLLIGGSKLWFTSTFGSVGSSATLYQASESGTLNGSISFSASTLGADYIEMVDLATDSSGNAYVLLGLGLTSTTIDNFAVVKVNSSISQVWATSTVSGSPVPMAIKLGSSGNPFVLGQLGSDGATYSFSSTGTLNSGQPFDFAMPSGSTLTGLAVINANGSNPDEPYVTGNGPDPNLSGSATAGFIACPLFTGTDNTNWSPSLSWTPIGATTTYSGVGSINLIGTDGKYIYPMGQALFNYPSSDYQQAPLWFFYGSNFETDFPTGNNWSRTFVGVDYTIDTEFYSDVYTLSPTDFAIDNEHDVLFGGGYKTMNGLGGYYGGLFLVCQSDVTGLGKSQTVIQADLLGLSYYPNNCVGVGASSSQGVAWALGNNSEGDNCLLEFTDNSTTFAYLGAATPPTSSTGTYLSLAVNPSTGDAYVLAPGYLSDYK